MAKSRAARTARKGGKRPKRANPRLSVKDTHESQYAQLLADPCSGPVHSPYGGEAGIVNRLVQDFTINTIAGHTAGVIDFTPSTNLVLTAALASSTATLTLTPNVGPGGTFINTNARKFRPVAACVTVLPSAASYNNLTGEIAVGVIGSDQLTTAVNAYTVDGIFTLLSKRAVFAKTQYDVKWFPGDLDHTYATVAAGGSATDPSGADHNDICVAYRGFPAGVPLSVRVTLIIEWTPQVAIGLPTSALSRLPVADHKAVPAIMSAKQPDWWHSLGNEVGKLGGMVGQDLAMAGRYLGRNVIAKGVAAAENWLGTQATRYVSGMAGAALLTM